MPPPVLGYVPTTRFLRTELRAPIYPCLQRSIVFQSRLTYIHNSPKAIAVLATVTAVGGIAAYSRVILPWHSTRVADLRRGNEDLSVEVERSGMIRDICYITGAYNANTSL